MSVDHDIQAARLTSQEIKNNFTDIHPPLTMKQALVASERCLFCYDAPCIQACPTQIDIPLFIKEINTNNAHGAAKEILSANILGGSCAKVCPTETLCEQACVRNSKEEAPVDIALLQRYAIDHLDTTQAYPFSREQPTGKHIAIVGAGPAGLACAHRLAQKGHKITIYEAAKKSGGLNEYGIAQYKLVNNYAQEEIDFVLKIGGIKIQYETALGTDISLASLRSTHDAVFIAIGLNTTNSLNIPGEDLKGVEDAIDYISELRQSKDMTQLPVGRRVVIIGAGMTAIDIAVQSKKLGAEEVSIVYRREQQSMGASMYEQELALTNGIRFIFNAQPYQIRGNKQGATHIQFKETTQDRSGKISTTDKIIELPCDVIFKAIGQRLNTSIFTHNADPIPEFDKRGRLKVDEQFQTSIEKVYAGGDAINGLDLVVEAVSHGNQAAAAIHQQLKD
ncbi:NAD(P)-dependent oxidoreductase [uncultured Shewanella sp.]|uniref:NAD(P)-dependent oxidoreductase n=1 Tax=uncultured Shewanella sp. TaxID=173975 RepID=UPI002639EBAB|nr:NAD(P)-dependent oxidoreductase [uncultured Shewanella sp.]